MGTDFRKTRDAFFFVNQWRMAQETAYDVEDRITADYYFAVAKFWKAQVSVLVGEGTQADIDRAAWAQEDCYEAMMRAKQGL